jgi:hypothetical protein
MPFLRWKFDDGQENWTVPVNPKTMSSPYPEKQMQVHATVRTSGQPLVFEGGPVPAQWQFSGRTQDYTHYSNLLRWTQKTWTISITDHVGRKMAVYLTGIKFTPSQSINSLWRYEYDVSAIVFSVGAPTITS